MVKAFIIHLLLVSSLIYLFCSEFFIVIMYCRSVLVTVGLGQTLSLLVCGTAVTSGLLQIENVLVPTGMYTVYTVALCVCVLTVCHKTVLYQNS